MKNKDTSPIHSLEAISKRLSVSVQTLKRYVKSGELKAFRIRGAYFVEEPDLMDFMATCK